MTSRRLLYRGLETVAIQGYSTYSLKVINLSPLITLIDLHSKILDVCPLPLFLAQFSLFHKVFRKIWQNNGSVLPLRNPGSAAKSFEVDEEPQVKNKSISRLPPPHPLPPRKGLKNNWVIVDMGFWFAILFYKRISVREIEGEDDAAYLI